MNNNVLKERVSFTRRCVPIFYDSILGINKLLYPEDTSEPNATKKGIIFTDSEIHFNNPNEKLKIQYFKQYTNRFQKVHVLHVDLPAIFELNSHEIPNFVEVVTCLLAISYRRRFFASKGFNIDQFDPVDLFSRISFDIRGSDIPPSIAEEQECVFNEVVNKILDQSEDSKI